MAKHTYYVKGMHCASCEVLIEKELLAIPGVTFADVSLARGSANIEYEREKPSVGYLNEKLKNSGYSFSDQAFKEKKGGGIWKTLAGAAIAIAAFLIITRLGLSSLINLSSESSLPAFFVFGLIAGISSCAALIGGLVLSLSKQWVEDYSKNGELAEKGKPHFLFNFGRIVSFSLLGFALGFLGEKFKISPTITSALILLVSGVMLVIALQMLGVKSFNRFRFTLPKGLSSRLIKDRRSNAAEPFVVGFLTFLLPCGFTVAAEGLAILSGNPVRGLLMMLFFVLGTMVPLLAIGFSSARFLSNHNLSEKFLKVAGILIIFFVAYNINFQFGISRFISEKRNSENQISDDQPRNEMSTANTQIIKAVYTDGSDIQPNSFSVKAGQPVQFEVNVRDNGYGCMSTIMIPGLWYQPLVLKKGQTLIMRFTPENAGNYQITCAMGVPRGILKVTD
ncbi:MAG: sulfite exporter TauE/SafE family protein [Patescibacteria group bacterium]|nr:sulfite exporter TauE/SafE family protein [Patescibacteria group bacterium]MCL5262036.1 sulfite exporter TauE/SafE family protein [Patescibacteria group bacterium]